MGTILGYLIGFIIVVVVFAAIIALVGAVAIYALINLIYLVIGFVLGYIVWTNQFKKGNNNLLFLTVIGIIPCIGISWLINDKQFLVVDIILTIVFYAVGLYLGRKKTPA